MTVEETRTRSGISGLVAAATALGVGELLAGLFASVPSPLASVGGFVVDSSPSFVKDFAIAVFGTADKAVLAIGTSVIALVLGWFTGVIAASRRVVGAVVLGGFAVLGIVAGWNEPFAEPVSVVAALAVAAATGWLALDTLLRLALEQEAPTDGLAGDASRRRFIKYAAVGSAGALAVGALGRRLLSDLPEVPDIEALPAQEVSVISDEFSFGIDGLTPVVVPNEDFYRIDTALVVPVVDERSWTLRVHGLVDQEVALDYDQLLAMDIVDEYVTIACVSNEVGGDLVGNALWSGVRLTEVLDAAGVQAGAEQIVGRSVDGFTAGFPSQLAFDGRDPLIAIAMNGEPLPRRHGFPARLIVPGLYGYVSATKWLTEIELTTWEGHDGYWIPRGWAKEAPIKTQSRIDVPTGRGSLQPGPNAVAGVAWAPLRGIRQVEVQVDDGDWQAAELAAPLSDAAWVQWKAVVSLDSGRHTLQVRATDGTGETQPAARVSPRPDGATGYDRVRVRVA